MPHRRRHRDAPRAAEPAPPSSHPPPSPGRDLLALQRAAGNAAVARLVVQRTKVDRTLPTDKYAICAAALAGPGHRKLTFRRKDAADLLLHPVGWDEIAAALNIVGVPDPGLTFRWVEAEPHVVTLADASGAGQPLRLDVVVELDPAAPKLAAAGPPVVAGPPMTLGSSSKVRTGPAEQKKAYEELRTATVDFGLARAGLKTETVHVRGTHDFSAERDAQLLRQLSAQFFWFVVEQLPAAAAEQEVQSTVVRDRLVVSANLDATVTALHAWIGGRHEGWLADVLLMQGPGRDPRAASDAVKLRDTLEQDDPAVRVGQLLRSLVVKPAVAYVDISNAADAKHKLTHDDFRHSILLCRGPDMHAEQKIVMALAKGGNPGPALIYGKKRPCTGCWTVLRFGKERLGLSIAFNVKYGFLWKNSTDTLVRYFKPLDPNPATFDAWLAGLAAEVKAGGMSVSADVKPGKRKRGASRTVKVPTGKAKRSQPVFSEVDPGRDSASESEAEDRPTVKKPRTLPPPIVEIEMSDADDESA